MLSQVGRTLKCLLSDFRHLDGISQDFQLLVVLVFYLNHHVAAQGLGIGKGLVDRVDWGDGDSFFQQFQPLLSRLFEKGVFKNPIEFLPVFEPIFPGIEFLITAHIRFSNRIAQFGKDAFRIRVNDDRKGPGLESPDRVGRNMARSDRAGDFVSDKIKLGAIGEQRGLAVDQADINLLAPSGLFPLIQSGQDPLGRKHPPAQIAHRCAHSYRHLVRFPGIAHDPASCLDHQIEGRPIPERTCLTVSGDGATDDARIDILQGIEINPQFFHHPGPEIVDHHIGFSCQIEEYFLPLFAFQIEGHAFLVSVHRNKVGRLTLKKVGRHLSR